MPWKAGMASSLRCADLGTACSAAFTAETEAELIEHVTLHAKYAHPEMELTPAAVERIKDLVRMA
jgi:predicted small metal-binding protein